MRRHRSSNEGPSSPEEAFAAVALLVGCIIVGGVIYWRLNRGDDGGV